MILLVDTPSFQAPLFFVEGFPFSFETPGNKTIRIQTILVIKQESGIRFCAFRQCRALLPEFNGSVNSKPVHPPPHPRAFVVFFK